MAKAAALLNGCFTRPIAVVGFPLGAGSSAAKAAETADAVAAGAAEIDMVLNIGALIECDTGRLTHTPLSRTSFANATIIGSWPVHQTHSAAL